MDDKIHAIAETCADYYGVTVEEMKEKRGSHQVCLARQAGMYLTREVLSLTYERIADYYGRDYTTVLKQCHQAEDEIEVSPSYETLIRRLGHIAQERVLPGSPNPPEYKDQAAANAIIALYFNAVTSYA